MLKFIVSAIAVAIAGVLVVAAFRPDHFRIERSARIDAAPERIFPLIEDLQRFRTWSPFEKDPAMKRSFSGPARGRGATYDFDGNNQAGAGRLSIADSVPPSRVDMTLAMTKPMKANNTITFTLTPEGDSTRVTWSMEGRSGFLAKLLHMFMDMDGMVGGEFETGLENLRQAVAEDFPSVIEGSRSAAAGAAGGHT